MADDALLDELRRIAKDEGVSLGKVIREALEMRARARRRPPSFIGKASSGGGGPRDAAARHDEVIAEYLRERHARY